MLWSYLSVTNCKPVAFKDDTYTDDAELVKAITAKYQESDMQRGVLGRFGWMGLGLPVLAGAAVWLKEKLTGKGDSNDQGQPA